MNIEYTIYHREFSYQLMNDEMVFVNLNVNNCQVNRHISYSHYGRNFHFYLYNIIDMWDDSLEVRTAGDIPGICLPVTPSHTQHCHNPTARFHSLLSKCSVQHSVSLSVCLCVYSTSSPSNSFPFLPRVIWISGGIWYRLYLEALSSSSSSSVPPISSSA